jgi:hypothetical protein
MVLHITPELRQDIQDVRAGLAKMAQRMPELKHGHIEFFNYSPMFIAGYSDVASHPGALLESDQHEALEEFMAGTDRDIWEIAPLGEVNTIQMDCCKLQVSLCGVSAYGYIKHSTVLCESDRIPYELITGLEDI